MIDFHEYANIFPLMEGQEFEELKEDIKKHGLKQTIILYEGKILDGRNRYNACIELGIEPKYEEYDGDEPLSYVISMNIKRRHLDKSQLAVIALDILPLAEQEAKKRMLSGKKTDPMEIIPQGAARDQVGDQLGVSGRMISDAKKIAEENPEMIEKLRKGETTITKAKRELKRTENRELAKNTPKLEDYVKGQKFSTILIDPPWDVSDEGDVNQMGRANPDYATMTIEEIEKLPIGELADNNAHIYLWITNRSLPKGFKLLESWGFRYITALTWCKSSIGIGNYFRNNTEHILFGVKGKMSLLRQDAGTWYQWERGKGHSSKPKEIYDLIESCSQGPYIELFAREKHRGWVSWGADVLVE
jgi:N6-adenosine-specific RNA methylase IME4